MRVLLYNEIANKKIPAFDKIKTHLENDDFHAAQVKKIGDNLYRARLDKRNRLLFSIYKHQGQVYALILEVILQHAYEKSRFLSGDVHIDEDKIPNISNVNEVETENLIYVNEKQSNFHLLDKIISFDDLQQDILAVPAPVIIIGSAGSGKTALTLEKMKEASGDILYVTRSAYLVHNSRRIYYSSGYDNESQTIDFLSFDDYLASIQVPAHKEMSFRQFSAWFTIYKSVYKLKDAQQVFEEFKGVLTGANPEKAYLNLDDYLNLGVKQSIFSEQERPNVYKLFLKYLDYMQEKGFYDSNILSYQYLSKIKPRYDFVIVDEVQDLTNVQLQLVLKSLHLPQNFILCGDSNQIVHPNFFSWSKVKTLFYQQKDQYGSQELIRVLNTNYRNSPDVTDIANKVLKIKTARFGSVDKESNYLVDSNAHNQGYVRLLPNDNKIKAELNKKSKLSTDFAIIVMHESQKKSVKEDFSTPLVFSIQEAKGLEYDNIILYDFISDDKDRFHEITKGVDFEHLTVKELTYSRVKDKTDKSLEIYKFYINALYVALTRAIKNVFIIESKPKQRLFQLLDLQLGHDISGIDSQESSLAQWQKEAHKLEMQGKEEQAEEIRKQILKEKTVPWTVLVDEELEKLKQNALEDNNKKAKLLLFEYAQVYHDEALMMALAEAKFIPALKKNNKQAQKLLEQKYYMFYRSKAAKAVLRQVDQYGVNFRNQFNQTPLMIATAFGNTDLVQTLCEHDAKVDLVNSVGLNAFQIALQQAALDKKYAQHSLRFMYRQLEADSTVVQVDERLIQLDNRSMEFVLFNLMVAILYTHLPRKLMKFQLEAFACGDLLEILETFPEKILPSKRKKRAYVSSILAKNERNGNSPYNRKLFVRIKRGHYMINPELSLRIGKTWFKFYDLFPLENMGYHKGVHHEPWMPVEQMWKNRLQQLIEWMNEATLES